MSCLTRHNLNKKHYENLVVQMLISEIFLSSSIVLFSKEKKSSENSIFLIWTFCHILQINTQTEVCRYVWNF